MLKSSLSNFILKLSKFLIIGFLGTIINVGILFLLTDYIGFYYIFSEIIAFCISLAHNFMANKVFTFKEKLKQEVFMKFSLYLSINLITLGINLMILYLLVEYFQIWYIFAEVFAILTTSILNFAGNYKWTFPSESKVDIK